MRDDLTAAFRSLRASPTFTAVALLVLALGIGASTAIFSVVDAVVLRGLPFDEHDRLVALGERRGPGPRPDPTRDPDALSSAAPQNYFDWAARQQVFGSIAAMAGSSATLKEPGAGPEDLRMHRVTAQFFDVLRVRPALGPGFDPEHYVPGGEKVMILSDGLWRRRFGGDAAIIGRMVPFEGGSVEVVGVMPAGFEYPVGAVRPTEFWSPFVPGAEDSVRHPQNFSFYLQAIARLKPGVTIEQAQAQMEQIALALEAEHPQWNKDRRVGVRPLRDHLVGARTKSWMLMLLGAVGIVLLIACANVANLLLARASTREREVGIRAALGAGRWRLVRQLMVESLALSTLGTVLAVVLAWWALDVLRTSMPDGIPRVTHIALDLRVLAAAALLAVATGLLFGVVPALQLSRPDLTTALKDGSRGASAGRGRQRLRAALVVAEVALAVVLLVGAALFIGSFVALMRIDPGIDAAGVLTAGVSPHVEPGTRPGDHAAAFTELANRLNGLPGVEHAAVISGGMPLGASMSSTNLTLPGQTAAKDDEGISLRQVTPRYHQALRIPLRSGRLFEPSDRPGSVPVVILNESAARKYFPGQEALGRAVVMHDIERTIVGIVGDVRQSSLELEPIAEAYIPVGQRRTSFGELIVRTTGGDPYDVLPAVRSTVAELLPDVPLRNVRTMEELLARRVAQRRLNMLLLGLFGLLGLVISAVGIYGVMAYVVAQRTKEIGVRMALGATRGRVVRMVLTNAVLLVGAGLAIGGVAAWYLSAAAKSFLFQLEPNDPRAFLGAVAVLALAALVASVVPARRAAGVDPMVALRAE